MIHLYNFILRLWVINKYTQNRHCVLHHSPHSTPDLVKGDFFPIHYYCFTPSSSSYRTNVLGKFGDRSFDYKSKYLGFFIEPNHLERSLPPFQRPTCPQAPSASSYVVGTKFQDRDFNNLPVNYMPYQVNYIYLQLYLTNNLPVNYMCSSFVYWDFHPHKGPFYNPRAFQVISSVTWRMKDNFHAMIDHSF